LFCFVFVFFSFFFSFSFCFFFFLSSLSNDWPTYCQRRIYVLCE
jgi:hypothetical protein